MPKFKNVSPYGALDFPLLGRVVEAGETFELTTEQAKHIKGQDANFRPVKAAEPRKRTAPKKKQAEKAAESATTDEGGSK